MKEETEEIKKQKEEIEVIASEAQATLDLAMPELSKAQVQIEKIDRNQLVTLRIMSAPPSVVVMVFEAVCILLGSPRTDWPSAKALLMDLNKFI